jgi:hypothetical protein
MVIKFRNDAILGITLGVFVELVLKDVDGSLQMFGGH